MAEMFNSLGARRRAVIFLILASILWSSSGLLIKLINWQPLSIFSARSFVAFFVVLAYLRRIDLRLNRLQIIGALGYIGAQILFITATKLTTAANAIFLQYASPLYVILFGYWLLKERPRRADWIAMAVIFTGMFLFFGDKLSFDGFYGNLLAILSGVGLAALVLSMRGQKDADPAVTILLGNFAGFFIGLPWLLRETFTLADAGIILYLGIFQLGLAFVLFSIAIKHVHALESNLIMTLEPILNPIWVFLVLGEQPGPLALVGCLLVIGAVTFRAVVSTRETET
jgi:drug/metabolite transporter (DMT)-like permease